MFYFAQSQQLATKADRHIANSRNSCLPTRIHPMQLKKSQKAFYLKLTQKKMYNNWHMISFIHCGSARNEVASYMGS